MGELAKDGGGLRAATRDAVRRQLSDVALDLFLEHGYDAITIEQIADEAGISARSVHRYFPAKEDLVIDSPEAYGRIVASALSVRPRDEGVMTSLYSAYAALMGTRAQDRRDKVGMYLLSRSASLRARNIEKHERWAELLTPIVSSRLNGKDADVRARALVQSSLSAFTLALTTWGNPEEERSVQDLLKVTFSDLLLIDRSR
ncbi:MAG: helix-turn-helix domain containing protein [Candidatus Microbacterium phytovorans]|uniref:Helix-turn-helix domain containing protein n=1 Tax=Candidatus Microbacterium phytovorans TaxID=3121374 RepID=A0AAJ5W1L1_9MICO|nr:TetR/AcrR family transcriptional regulator [Microbacterium sp.]WEK12961.1 MAG: helix-turn-helix domain containing protein [Microbacterium sp.]